MAHQVEREEVISMCMLPVLFGASFCCVGKADFLFGFIAFETRLTTDYSPSVLACLLLGLDLWDHV